MSKYKKDISRGEFERIERFLLGEMGHAERADFETELDRNEQLRHEVGLQRKLLATVESGSANMDEQLKKTRKNNDTPRFLRYRWYAVAASVALAVGIWHFGFRQTPEEKLFATYFVPATGLVTPMKSTDDYVLYDAMVDYKRENYRSAIAKWKPLLQQRPENDTLNYFVGVAYLATGNAGESLPYLERTTTVAESIFIDEAWFYLGMARMKTGDTEQAKSALEKSSLERSKAVLRRLNE